MSRGRIRIDSPDDARAIAHIHVDTWRSTYAGILPGAYLVQMDIARQFRMWRHTIRSSGNRHDVLVAESADGQVVGFASCGPARRDGAPHRAAHDGEIYTLYVAVDYQGQGHGARLLTACLDAMRRRGMASAIVWVLAENPSRFFYEAQGGQKIAERIESFAGTGLAEFAYGWDLQARA